MEHGDANTSMVVLKKLLFYNLLLVTETLIAIAVLLFYEFD